MLSTVAGFFSGKGELHKGERRTVNTPPSGGISRRATDIPVGYTTKKQVSMSADIHHRLRIVSLRCAQLTDADLRAVSDDKEELNGIDGYFYFQGNSLVPRNIVEGNEQNNKFTKILAETIRNRVYMHMDTDLIKDDNLRAKMEAKSHGRHRTIDIQKARKAKAEKIFSAVRSTFPKNNPMDNISHLSSGDRVFIKLK